jgi:hypothetical protein
LIFDEYTEAIINKSLQSKFQAAFLWWTPLYKTSSLQTLKNALAPYKLGGAAGGSDFDPKGKSDNEVSYQFNLILCSFIDYNY